jgi:hypothetical protein
MSEKQKWELRKPWSELWWVSVGGSKCEPARVVFKVPHASWTYADLIKTVYTIGCPDGTVMSPDCGVEMVERMESAPPTPKEKAALEKAWAAKRSYSGLHGYRRFP